MTRQQILKDYQVNAHGIIQSPGKFEGEMLYAPYFYDAMLNGESEHVNGVDYFDISAEDKSEFPELAAYDGLALEESGQGFVHVDAMTQADYEQDKNFQSEFGPCVDEF